MPRRGKIVRRQIMPDVRYGSADLARFISKLMVSGKRSTAERVIYQALDIVGEKTKRAPLDVFDQALRNATPLLEVKPRRVGGATYQVPVEIRGDRRVALGMRWLLGSARARKGQPMAQRLAGELMDAAAGQGATIKRRDDLHKMAEANKAFAHYRW